jgi:hypothetical protein
LPRTCCSDPIKSPFKGGPLSARFGRVSFRPPRELDLRGPISNEAIQRLQTYKNSGEPFFLAIGFFKPHLPFNAPKKYWNLYDRNAITVPPNVPPANVNLSLTLSDNGEFLGNYGGTNTIDAAEAKLSIHGYRTCVSYTDAQIGKLLTLPHRALGQQPASPGASRSLRLPNGPGGITKRHRQPTPGRKRPLEVAAMIGNRAFWNWLGNGSLRQGQRNRRNFRIPMS